MRRMIRTTVAAAGLILALGVASAADRDEVSPEGRAYFGFSFGGQKIAPRDLRYGLRIDHDARFLEGEAAMMAPLMKLDFTGRGFADASVNGLSVIKQSYKLRQSEEQAAEEAGTAAEPPPVEEGAPAEEAPAEGGEEAAAEGAAEEGGFFSNMWGGVTGFFGGLFGGGDEEEVAEEAAPAEEAPAETAEAPAEDAATEGAFLSYDVVDWGLLAVGLAGVGMAASEAMQSDESLDLADSDGDGISDGDDPTPVPPGTPCTVTVPIPLPPGCDPNAFTGRDSAASGSARIDPAYQDWLDGGTGQMGDLGAH